MYTCSLKTRVLGIQQEQVYGLVYPNPTLVGISKFSPNMHKSSYILFNVGMTRGTRFFSKKQIF